MPGKLGKKQRNKAKQAAEKNTTGGPSNTSDVLPVIEEENRQPNGDDASLRSERPAMPGPSAAPERNHASDVQPSAHPGQGQFEEHSSIDSDAEEYDLVDGEDDRDDLVKLDDAEIKEARDQSKDLRLW